MPTIFFFLFLRLNGFANGLKPRIYYITLHYTTWGRTFAGGNTIKLLCTLLSIINNGTKHFTWRYRSLSQELGNLIKGLIAMRYTSISRRN